MKKKMSKADISLDHDNLVKKEEALLLKKRYQESLKIIGQLQKENEQILQIKQAVKSHTIVGHKNEKTEATAFMVASDFHIESTVLSEQVNELNEFNLDIANKRINNFFVNGLKLVNMLAKDNYIENIVLALLGDFITNTIHDDDMESNSLSPIEAIMKVQEHLTSGINYLLKNSKFNLIIPCSNGNHSRTTEKMRCSTEYGNSLETMMYCNLAQIYKNNKRIKFIIGKSYHTYLDVYGYKIRFHHGHALKFAGGIGGLFIPAYKAIASWNNANHAYLDVFGHFHSFRDGGSFIANGSLIGYNPYAIKIKASYEKPQQTFFLIQKGRGKTITTPIFLE